MVKNSDILKIIYRIDGMASYYDSIELIKKGAESDNFTNPQNVLKQIFYMTGNPSIYLLEKYVGREIDIKDLPKNLSKIAISIDESNNIYDILNAVGPQKLSPYICLAKLNCNYVNENNNVYRL